MLGLAAAPEIAIAVPSESAPLAVPVAGRTPPRRGSPGGSCRRAAARR